MKIGVKQVISLMLAAMIILILCNPVKAASSYAVELTGNNTVQQGEQIEITIKVKDIVDITGGIAGLSAKLEYDTTKLEKVGDGQSLNGFMLVEGETIELAKYPGVTSDTEVAKFTFKAKTDATGSTEIKLTGIEAADGSNTYPLGQDITKTIQITVPTGETTKSNNNNLSSISIDGTAISGFDKNTLTYNLPAVDNSKSSINITATTEDPKSTVTGTGSQALSVGNNTFKIVVAAEDATPKTYTINVTRNSTSNTNGNSGNNGSTTGSSGSTSSSDDKSDSGTKLPYTGINDVILFAIPIILVISIISYIKFKKINIK